MTQTSFLTPYRCILLLLLLTAVASGADVLVETSGSQTQLRLEGGQPFHVTQNQVTDVRLVEVPNSTVLLVLWNEHLLSGEVFPHYAISLDGCTFAQVRRTSERI